MFYNHNLIELVHVLPYNRYFLRLKIFAVQTQKGIKSYSAFSIAAITLVHKKNIVSFIHCFKFQIHLSCVLRDSAGGSTTERSVMRVLVSPLLYQPPFDSSCCDCRVVNVFVKFLVKHAFVLCFVNILQILMMKHLHFSVFACDNTMY